MAEDYQQQDTNAPCGVIQACSPVAPAGDSNAKLAEVSGTPGSTELTCDVASGGSELCYADEIAVADDTSLDAGDSTVRLNITTAQGNLTWEEVYVCRLNSSCTSQETLGSVTGLGVDISGGGVFNQTVSLNAASAHNAGDVVYVTYVFANSHNHASRSVAITPDQLLTMPFTAAAGGQTVSRTLSDSISFSENVNRDYDGNRSVSDAIPFSDQINRNYEGDRSLSDVVAFSDSLSRDLSVDRTPQDAVTFTENLLRNLGMGRDATDSLPFSENLTRTVETDAAETINRTLLDSISFSENLTHSVTEASTGQTVNRTLLDSLTLSENLQQDLDAGRILQDNTTLSENLTRTIAAPSKSVVTTFMDHHYIYCKPSR